MRMKRAIVSLTASLVCGPSFAQEQSSVTTYAGASAVSDGFADRSYVGSFVNIYDGDLGVHGDFLAVNREENALYGAIGMSWTATDRLRPRLMIGTSSNNSNILPEFSAAVSLQFAPGERSGWILTPAASYRSYRNGGEETRLSFEAAKYFTLPNDTGGYYVAQAKLGASRTDSGAEGYTFGGGIQTIRKSGLAYGINFEAGRVIYDSFDGIGAENNYHAVRPTLGFRFDDREIFVRGEFVDTQFYSLVGAMVGFKVQL